MAQTGQRISELAASLPRLAMIKHNVAVEPNRIYSLMQRAHDELEREGVEYDQTDGIKVAREGGWVHVRVSNTESMIRIIAEAETERRAQALLDYARDMIGK
jgi:phosphomannomutase